MRDCMERVGKTIFHVWAGTGQALFERHQKVQVVYIPPPGRGVRGTSHFHTGGIAKEGEECDKYSSNCTYR